MRGRFGGAMAHADDLAQGVGLAETLRLRNAGSLPGKPRDHVEAHVILRDMPREIRARDPQCLGNADRRFSRQK